MDTDIQKGKDNIMTVFQVLNIMARLYVFFCQQKHVHLEMTSQTVTVQKNETKRFSLLLQSM